MSFATPLWLFGLLLVPVIRWMHRTDLRRPAFEVAQLRLWQTVADSTTAAHERGPPDPAWRRRALLAALLVIALSGPETLVQSRRITIWIDDSLSMLVHERDGTRLAQGLAQVAAAVRGMGDADVELRTLGNPWHNLGPFTDRTAATVIAGAGQVEPGVPPSALLAADRSHWLLTDGADASLFDWPDAKHPDRIFEVAEVTRNVGLESISARRNIDDSRKIDVLVKVTNGGTAVEVRSVDFVTDAGTIAGPTLRLQPGGFAFAKATVAAAPDVHANLQPADDLVADDGISLDLRPLRRRHVWVDANCPASLVNAIRAHPALLPVNPQTGDVEAAVDCESRASSHGVPSIHVLADRPPTALHGPVQWSAVVPESDRFDVEPDTLQRAARLMPGSLDTVLLAVGGEPLVVRRAGAVPILMTALDFPAAPGSSRQDIPLFVDFMFENLLGGQLLDGIVVADRGAAAVRVAPTDRARATAAADAQGRRVPYDASRPLLVAAMLLLAWEILALGRRHLRMRRSSIVGWP